ncbi:MAG: TVP38/TMEM64 family protein [wastewater metagenome]|nr:TVP38/TMEM64 family protein [Candidatus Loosdrechtia aerotolerans]
MHFFINQKKITQFLHSLGAAKPAGFILLQIFQVIVAPIPGELTIFLGGYLFGHLGGIILSTIGLTLGSYIAFILARILGRPFVESFVPKAIIDRFDYFLHRKGAFLAFILFTIPGFPKDYFCYILGFGHLTTLEFFLISGTGRLLSTIFLALGGSYLRNQQYRSFSIFIGVVIIIVFSVLSG